MSHLFIYLLATIITLPLPFLVVFYFCARKWSRKKRKAVHLTSTVTTPVFILAVHVLLVVIFDQSFLSYLIVLQLALLGLTMIVQYKLEEEVNFKRAFKGFWRVNFLLFMFGYMGLSLYGLLDTVWL